MRPSSGNFGFMNILMSYYNPFYNRQSKIALQQTLTLQLGVTLVLTVTQVYVFVNLCRVTSVPPYALLLELTKCSQWVSLNQSLCITVAKTVFVE